VVDCGIIADFDGSFCRDLLVSGSEAAIFLMVKTWTDRGELHGYCGHNSVANSGVSMIRGLCHEKSVSQD
jgi:hypothetical protein